MEKISNEKVKIQLDSEKGILCMSGLHVDTMVYLYNEVGELQLKDKCVDSSLVMSLPRHGRYVLVIFHPTCQVEVRKIVF